jgi:phospholipase C
MRAYNIRRRLLACVSAAALLTNIAVPPVWAAKSGSNDNNTATPIKHVIIIVGENRSFDHLFATYQPNFGETVWNLLSQNIIKADGTPGTSYAKSAQIKATDTTVYTINPTSAGPYATLPPPTTGGAHQTPDDSTGDPFATLAAAQAADHAIPNSKLTELTTGATGLPPHSIDTRITYDGKPATALPDGVYQISGPNYTYHDYEGSPVHRFYQMWQQTDCAKSHITTAHPYPCLNDLFAWLEVTTAAGNNGAPPPPDYGTPSHLGEGSIAMGFYNVQQGDVPYFNQLAHQYALADNYHQPAMGGTGADSLLLGMADLPWFSDGKGNPATPPVGEIENPNPLHANNTVYNNWYTEDGYGASPFTNPNPSPKGGSYSECTNPANPGVFSILTYLGNMGVKSNCEPGHYYLLNNYNPGFFGNGQVDTINTFTIPPTTVPSIADVLLKHNVSWAYYGEGWNAYVQSPNDPNNVYCNICNPFQYQAQIMRKPEVVEEHLKDVTDFYENLEKGILPAVSFVKPGALNDGHPTSSKFEIFEAFTQKVVNTLHKHPALTADTAVFITVDEGGGYYDSGYIQPLDFFGDGTRIPLIVVSPFSKGGHVDHQYGDHASLLKFIEKNWKLPTISGRSRDNLPNPKTNGNPYVPVNGPAVGDLMGMFHF